MQTQGELQEATSLAEERQELAQQLQRALEEGAVSAKVHNEWVGCPAAQRSWVLGHACFSDSKLGL